METVKGRSTRTPLASQWDHYKFFWGRSPCCHEKPQALLIVVCFSLRSFLMDHTRSHDYSHVPDCTLRRRRKLVAWFTEKNDIDSFPSRSSRYNHASSRVIHLRAIRLWVCMPPPPLTACAFWVKSLVLACSVSFVHTTPLPEHRCMLVPYIQYLSLHRKW